MTLLNGGFGQKRFTDMPMGEFIDEFIAAITDDEWRVLAMLPYITSVTELIAVVAEIRSAPEYPLHPFHPLNPASRYETAS